MSFLSFIYFHHFFCYLFLSSPGYKQTIIDGGKVLIVQYVLSEIYNTCNFALHLALECNFRLTAYLWKKIEKGWTLVMSPPPSSGNVACLSCGHQGKSFGVLPWGSAFYSGEGWGRGLSRKCNYYSGYVQQGNFTTIVEETGAMYISALLYISLPSSILAAPLWPPRRAPSPYQHIRIGTHSSGRTYNVPLGKDHLASLDIRVNGEGNHENTISICYC